MPRKNIIFAVALLLALIVTGGSFAYGVLTDTQTMGLAERSDFAEVVPADTPPSWDVFGSCIGKVDTGGIFIITPDGEWTGDMVCQVSLVNAPDLVSAYRFLILEIEVWDNHSQLGTTEYLTLHRSTIDIEFGQTASPYTVWITGGSYITHRAGWDEGNEDPILLCEVLQR